MRWTNNCILPNYERFSTLKVVHRKYCKSSASSTNIKYIAKSLL